MTAQQQYTEHLLGLKRAEVASELEQQGYVVESDKQFKDRGADLVARKPDGTTVVYQFKVPASLRSYSEQIRNLRQMATENGFEFKLVVVTPPKRIDVTVDGLAETLDELFREDLHSTSLSSLASQVIVEDVTDVEITSLNVHGNFTDVAGHGVVEVRLEYGGGEEKDGVTSYDAFPFNFDVVLNTEHKVTEIRALEVDTSSFYE